MVRFVSGFVAALILLAAAVFAAVWFGFVPARADSPPASPLERWAARTSLNATIRREMPQLPYPYPPSDANVIAGAKLYMQNCAVCHGSGVGEESNAAKGMYVHPPQFAKHGVDDDPEGMNYWKIEHGIRFTGMPAYANLLSEEQIWQIAAFVTRPLKDLPPAAAAEFNQAHGD
jgi:mono/diheme cytochrome c family protein